MIRSLGKAKLFVTQLHDLRHYWRSPVSALQFLWRLYHRGDRFHMLHQFHLEKIRFFVRPTDWFGLEEIILQQEYSFAESVFSGSSPATVVDLGANIGLFSIYAFSLWPSVTVHSVEPSWRTYRILERNRIANPDLNWHVYHYAAWCSEGEMRFVNSEYSTGGRIGDNDTGDEIVPTIGLSALLSSYVRTPVDLMKMDIEGAEEAVLSGSQSNLQSVKRLIVEVHPQRCDLVQVVSVLRTAYEFLYQIPGRRSSKPLLLATRQPYPFPDYQSP